MNWVLTVVQDDGRWFAFAHCVEQPLDSCWRAGRATRAEAVEDLDWLADWCGPEHVTYAEGVV